MMAILTQPDCLLTDVAVHTWWWFGSEDTVLFIQLPASLCCNCTHTSVKKRTTQSLQWTSLIVPANSNMDTLCKGLFHNLCLVQLDALRYLV